MTRLVRRRRRRRTSPSKKQACTRCGEEKLLVGGFNRDKTRSSGYFPWCKDCIVLARQEAKQTRVVGDRSEDRKCPICEVPLGGTHHNRLFCSNPCKDKASRWRRFGLEPEEYKRVVREMYGKCPICGRNVKKWVIDHDHKTGEATGLCCTVCNIGLLAYSGHSAEVARALVEYLENPPIRRLFGERRFVGPNQVSQLHRRWAWSGKPGAPAEEAA